MHIFVEKRDKEEVWKKIEEKFNFSGSFYYVFANKKNSGCLMLKGIPDDSEYLNTYVYNIYINNAYGKTNKQELEENENYHSFSYLTLKELLDFAYDKKFWSDTTSLIKENFWLDELKKIGEPENVRIIFYFEN